MSLSDHLLCLLRLSVLRSNKFARIRSGRDGGSNYILLTIDRVVRPSRGLIHFLLLSSSGPLSVF